MSNSLTDLIRQKKAQIAQLQKELDEALGELTGAGNGHAVRTRTTGKKAAAPSLFGDGPPSGGKDIIPTSSVGRSIEILRQADKPLRIAEIMKRLEASGHKVNKSTLVGGLSRYVKLKRVFYRAAPNTFGLMEHRRP